MKYGVLLLIIFSLTSAVFAQNTGIGVGTVNPDQSAALDVTSTNKGFLPPRMTTIQRDSIQNPAIGLQIYNITTHCLEIFDFGRWRSIYCFPTGLLKFSINSSEDVGGFYEYYLESPDSFSGSFTIDDIRLELSMPVEGEIDAIIEIDTSLIAAYNNAHNLSHPYFKFPDSTYLLPSNTLTIRPGQSISEAFSIIFFPNKIDTSLNYLLPIKIAHLSGDAGGIFIDTLRGVTYFIFGKKALQGNYVSNGYFYHPSAPRPITDRPKFLTRLTQYKLRAELGDLGGSGYFAIFEIDPISNKVKILEDVIPVTQFDLGLPMSDPGYSPQWSRSAECSNIYDPLTGSIKVRYGYLGGPTGTTWRVVEEILQRQ